MTPKREQIKRIKTAISRQASLDKKLFQAKECPYKDRCSSYPDRCKDCIHDPEPDHFEPKDAPLPWWNWWRHWRKPEEIYPEPRWRLRTRTGDVPHEGL